MIPLAYVYVITNKETGEFYIGSRTAKIIRSSRIAEDDLLKFYFTSCKLSENIESNPDNYDGRIIFRSNETIQNADSGLNEFVVFWYEQLLIRDNFNNSKCLNRTYFDPDTSKHCFLTAGRCFRSEENNKKHSEFLKQYHANLDEEKRLHRSLKCSLANKGKSKSKEHIEKMKVPKSETHKQKLRGVPKSDETKRKMSESAKKRIRKPMSEETKMKIATSRKIAWDKKNEAYKNN